MRIDRIELDGFRNYDKFDVSFDRACNVITGDNATGKTNLLEAIYYLTGGKSWRTRLDRELIGFGKEAAHITGMVFSGGREKIVEACLWRNQKKAFLVNGIKMKTAGELAGNFAAVLFCPEDLSLVRDGAQARRRFLDLAISQLRPRYARLISEHQRLYEHKIRILKDFHEKPSLLDTLDDFSLKLAHVGAEIINFRAGFIQKLRPHCVKLHTELSDGMDELKLNYKTVSAVENPLRPPDELLILLLEHQKKHRQAELNSGLCLSGAHKDDLEIEINGQPARSFASQGQLRSVALSLKLAEREVYGDDTGETPVLLLDDVLSELDPRRQDFVLNHIKTGQVFITCCDGGKMAKQTGGKQLCICT